MPLINDHLQFYFFVAKSRFEELLTKIENKREDLNVYEKKLMALSREKSNADDEMRDLEKSLVEILVDQQKKLLAISSRDD